jgi:hypothetical protein
VNTDVLVIGGGAAGVAAATAAGRAGAKVVLLERYGFLGGLATAGQVGTVCGLYLRDSARAQPTLVAGGFIAEFAARLQQATGRGPLRLEAGLWVLPYSIGAFARVADALISESGKVTPVLHATMAEANTEGPRLVEVGALAWNERLSVRANAVVDCTGESTAAALGGAGVADGAADQVPALVFCLEDVDPALAERGLLELRRELRRAVVQGSLPAACERLALVPGTGSDGRLSLKLNLPAGEPGRPCWQQVTDWERQARALVDDLHRFLVDNIASCRRARLRSVAPQLGIRSGRRIQGRTTLTDQDVVGASKSPPGIARGCWPMERWAGASCADADSPQAGAPTFSRLKTSAGPQSTRVAPGIPPSRHGLRPDNLRPEMIYFEERGYYEIPLDCLRPVELDNVLVAGRCFSAEAGAMTSARVIGTAWATGWAAGTAAAFQAMGRPMDEAVDAIQKQMRQ